MRSCDRCAAPSSTSGGGVIHEVDGRVAGPTGDAQQVAPWRRNCVHAAAAIGLLYFLWRSIAEIADLCDFEVFWATAVRVLDGRLDFYEVPSPVKGRHFFYPPSAAVLLAPLGLVPQLVAGVVWSVAKTVALAALLWLSCGSPSESRQRRMERSLLTALLVMQPITSDFGNGQINTLVAAFAVLGCLGLMREQGRQPRWGAFALAVAVALKATPAIFLLLPLVRRRWRALAWALVAIVLMVGVLPVMAFGPSATKGLFAEFSEGSSTLVQGAGNREKQVSLNEVILFTLAQTHAARESAAPAPSAEDQAASPLELATESSFAVPIPLSGGQIQGLWLAQVALVLALCWWLRRRVLGGSPSWQWDFALLCLLLLFLSPMVRRAHLVLLLVPVGWLVRRGQELWLAARAERRGAAQHAGSEAIDKGEAAGCEAFSQGRWVAVWSLAGLGLCALVASKHLSIPSPAGFSLDYHPALFVSLLGMIGSMFAMGDRVRSGDESARL